MTASDEASFIVSERIAKSSKQFTEGIIFKKNACSKLVTPSVPTNTIFEKKSHFLHTAAGRISEMSENIENGLTNKCQSFGEFSIAVDESTDVSDNAQCTIFVRLVDKFESHGRSSGLGTMKVTTTGVDFFLS